MSQRPPPARSEQLSAMHRDIDRLSDEARSLAGSLKEEAVGAEILATRDLVANVGIVWETAEQLGDLYARQARLLLEDHLQTWRQVLDGSGGSTHDVVGDHLERRVRHVTQGVEEGIQVMARQSERAGRLLAQIWNPFLAVVRQDWQRRGRDPG